MEAVECVEALAKNKDDARSPVRQSYLGDREGTDLDAGTRIQGFKKYQQDEQSYWLAWDISWVR